MSRLQYVPEMKEDERMPIILPYDSPVTDALVYYYHHRVNQHAGGRGSLSSEVGTRFWLPRIGLKADQILKKCHRCKQRDVQSATHDFAPLPPGRVKREGSGSFQVFRDIGMDLFGPYYIHERHVRPAQQVPPEPRGRGRPKKDKPETSKRWIIIFSCMKIRAVHCEYLRDCSEEEILMALERFCLARGTPDTIFCDRGKYFIGAEDTLRRHWERLNEQNPRLREHFADIDFYFNPAYAPNYGGHYERLIGLVKRAMEPLYRTPNLTDSILYTVMRRAENLVNSRPLAVRTVPDSADPQPITPAHFLRGRIYRRLADIGEGPFSRDWQYVETLTQRFFENFVKNCSPLYNFDYSKDTTEVEFQKGDVVWILNEKSPVHGTWPMGKISDVIVSRDGKIRTVHVSYDGKDLKKAIKDVALVISEPQATTITSESGLVLLPQHPVNNELYRHEKAGNQHIW